MTTEKAMLLEQLNESQWTADDYRSALAIEKERNRDLERELEKARRRETATALALRDLVRTVGRADHQLTAALILTQTQIQNDNCR